MSECRAIVHGDVVECACGEWATWNDEGALAAFERHAHPEDEE